MKKNFCIVGSGMAAANAALTLLERGHTVEMFDYGKEDKKFPKRGSSFQNIKKDHISSLKFFYGSEVNDITYKKTDEELFKYPSRRVGISYTNFYKQKKSNFNPYFGNVKGGLGTAWGANIASFTDSDLIDFPIKYDELKTYYKKAFERMALQSSNSYDNLTEQINPDFPKPLNKPLEHQDLNLCKDLEKVNSFDFRSGQSRLAIRGEGKNACTNSGLCIWGCPENSIYSPLETLKKCFEFKAFKYNSNTVVKRFTSNGRGKLTKIVYTENGVEKHKKIENVVLGAGALNSGIILLSTVNGDRIEPGGKLSSIGLLDTKVIKIPFIHIPSLAYRFNTSKIQFNRLVSIFKVGSKSFPKWIQVELLGLGSLIYHPMIKRIGLGVKISTKIFNFLKSGLFVATIFLPDKMSKENRIIVHFSNKEVKEVEFRYTQTNESLNLENATLLKLKKILIRAKCIFYPFLRITPDLGSGIHYAGTIPMQKNETSLAVDKNCKSYDYDNLHVCDASSFPSLPSKSLTMTIIANSIRISEKL